MPAVIPEGAASRVARSDAVRLGLAGAQPLAWAGLALVDAAFIAGLKTRAPWPTRALHHLYDAGQLLAAGFVAALVVVAWRRVAPRAWTWVGSTLGLCLAASALAWAFLRPDLVPFAWRVASEERADLVLAGLTLGAAATLAVAALVGRWLARPWLRWLGVGTALAVAIANDVVLANDYRGVHLFASLAAAILAAASLDGTRLPDAFAAPRARRATHVACAILGLVAAFTVIVPPRASVRAEMLRVEGAVVLPVLASLQSGRVRGTARIPPGAQAWFIDRRRLPAVPASSPRVQRPDAIVLLLSADSMRADLLSRDNVRGKLPELDRLRREGVEFTRARSPSSRTVYTWASVFTGRYHSGIRWRGINPGRDRAVRFSAQLSRAGIATVNVISCSDEGASNPQLGEGNLRGGFTEQLIVGPRAGQQYATSTEAMPVLIERLRRQGPGPLFLFAHFMDPHYPYDSAQTKGSRFNRFVAEVRQVDRAIRRLRKKVEELGIAERTTFIVTADHGEAFGQHDTPYHTLTLYEELLHVPLFVRVPGVRARQVAEPVTLMDLGPTILDLFGLPTPASFLGQSLVPYLRGEDPVLRRPIAAEKPATRALVLGSHKIIVDRQKGSEEIYDLAVDPEETHNLIETLGKAGEAKIDTLRAFFGAHAVGKR